MSPDTRGTSLIEVVVALALVALLTTSLFFMRSTALRDDDAQERRQAFHHDLLLMKARLRRDLRSALRLERVGEHEWHMTTWSDGDDGWPVSRELRWRRLPGEASVERIAPDGVRRWTFARSMKGEDFVFQIDS